jgi:hypothetical protein
MDTEKKGDLILRKVTGLGGEAILVSMLHRVYPSVSPGVLLTLLSKPRPHVLIRNISETKAMDLKRKLQAQGTVLVFVPSTGESWFPESLPASSIHGPQETRAVATVLTFTPPPSAGPQT